MNPSPVVAGTATAPAARQPRASAAGRPALSPFRGVRFAPGEATLSELTSPPDVHLDPAALRALRRRAAHNVRGLLPGGTPWDGLPTAAVRLRRWLSDGVLVRDRVQSLYVYEQARGERVLQRGLIGALGVREPREGAVLPHARALAADPRDTGSPDAGDPAGADIEPLYGLYRGDGPRGRMAALLAETVRATPPLGEATAEDGLTHRLWALTAPHRLAAVAAVLRDRQVLLADGHRRWAAARALRAAHRARGSGPGPWDHRLALLVDVCCHRVPVHPVHRVVPGVPVGVAAARAAAVGRVRRLPGALDAAVATLAEAARGGPAFLLSGEGEHHLVTGLRGGPSRPGITALHQSLFPLLPLAADGPPRAVRASQGAVVTQARQCDGTAVLLHPPTLDELFTLAGRGELLPPRSTAFGLRPRTGMVLRVSTGP